MPKEYFKMSIKSRRIQRFPRPQATISLLTTALLPLLLLIEHGNAAVHSVFTHSNASTTLGQLVTSSTLLWESYDVNDAKQLQYAVEGGKFITNDEHYPIYVCRVNIDGEPTSGHTEKIMQSHVCVAAHKQHQHKKHEVFDVLVNKGHFGKIAWKHWRKFNAGIPVGAIKIGVDSYIARHRAPHQHHAAAETEADALVGADFNLGRLVPIGLGKIRVVENGIDKEYDEGEVLVETEPFRYELKDIKLDKLRSDMRENVTDLAYGVLVNREDKYSLVETVLTYSFDYMQYWGYHEGLARGLPTKIFEKDVSKPAEIQWSLKKVDKRVETKTVHTQLLPGTAMNVTLKGNYVTLEAPYTAKLFAYYYGSEENMSRKIAADVRKGYLKDVKLEFSPVYWIENGTFVPTSTTTSTTTHATTTSTEAKPMHEPPVVRVEDVGQSYTGADTLEKMLQNGNNNNEVTSNELADNLAEQQKQADIKAAENGSTVIQFNFKMATLLTVMMMMMMTKMATLF